MMPRLSPDLNLHVAVGALIVNAQPEIGRTGKTVPMPKTQAWILIRIRHRKGGDADESRILAGRIVTVQACRCTVGARKRTGASRVRPRSYGWRSNLPDAKV